MAESNDSKADESAEKAYTAAADAVRKNDEAVETPVARASDGADEAIEFPAMAKRGSARAEEDQSNASPAVVAPQADAKPVAQAKPKVSRARAAAKPAVVKPKVAKPAKLPAKPVVKRAPKAVASPPAKAAATVVRKPSTKKITAKAPAPAAAKPAVSHVPFIAKIKDFPMDMSSSIADAVSGAQEKAKEAFTKGSAFAGEYTEFAKGNVEAVVESGKILAAGLQDMGSKFVADGKSAFETLTGDVKELSSVKSPTDFLKLQTDLLRRNFDNAIAYGSKTSEAMLKLTSDVIAPISSRVTLAVDKVRNAA